MPRAPAASGCGALVVLAALALVLGGCGESVPVPVARLVDAAPPPASAALAAGRYVTVAEVARPTLRSARALRAPAECAPGAGFAAGVCSVRVPDEVASAPVLLVELALEPERGAKDGRVVRQLVPTPADRIVVLPRGLHAQQIRQVTLRGVPPLAASDFESAPLEVPPGATLRFALARDAATDGLNTAPVALDVAALAADGEHPLFARVVDPAGRADRGWIEAEVALDALRGKTVRLRFRARPAKRHDRRPALVLWGDPTVWAAARVPARPTVVLVSLDTLRAKSTSTWGNPRATSPYLTELAGGATLFERAFTTFSNTLGSHMSMMTGLYPATHGVIGLERTLGAEHATLAGTLRRAGYDTAAFTEDGLLEGPLGFERGFSSYAASKGVFSAAGDAPGTFARALDWARPRGRAPFFLFVHTYAVHLPYEPPPEYAQLFTDGDPAALPPVELQRLRYEQEVRALDDELRKLVAGLEEIVPKDRLLLVVTSDHGEEFGEHGQVTHLQLFDEVMHVPLVVRLPAQRAGARVAAPFSLADLMPTLLEVAGVAAPASDGVSFAGVLQRAAAPPERAVVYGQSLPYALTGNQWRFVARARDAKCMVPEDGAGDCWDLAADPDEQRPLPPTQDAALGALHEAAIAYRTKARATIAAAGAVPFADGADTVDEATRRKLRALGYVD